MVVRYKMSFEDFIDEDDIEFVNELENPKKYHYEEHSDDTIHFYEDGEEIDYEEVVDLLNGQDCRIKELESELNNFKPIVFKNNGEDLILYSKKGDVLNG